MTYLSGMKPLLIFSFLSSLLAFSGISCSKHKDVSPLGAGLFLSCDLPPHRWYPFKDFLKENHIKVTFYIEGFQNLTTEQKAQAKMMMADGHEIAHHTATHPNLDEYLKTHTLQEYMDNEILPMKKQMEAEGFPCNTFAYPNGASTKDADKELLNHFQSVRKLYDPNLLKKLENIDAVYYRYGENEILVAASIDRKRKLSLTEILKALEKAKKSKQTLSLYCHEIAFNGIDQGEYSIDESDLKAIVQKSVELGLKSYTATELSKPR